MMTIGIIAFGLVIAFAVYKYISFNKEEKMSIEYPFEEMELDVFQTYLLKLINNRRRAEGVQKPDLKPDRKACELAKNRCLEMIEEQSLSHLKWVDDHNILVNLGAGVVGENIAYGYSSPLGVVNAWMKSNSHKRNLLNPIWDYIGIGVIVDDMGRRWYCTLFLTD